jgi:hypothetical protein
MPYLGSINFANANVMWLQPNGASLGLPIRQIKAISIKL